jgi:hypothetical protein
MSYVENLNILKRNTEQKIYNLRLGCVLSGLNGACGLLAFIWQFLEYCPWAKKYSYNV